MFPAYLVDVELIGKQRNKYILNVLESSHENSRSAQKQKEIPELNEMVANPKQSRFTHQALMSPKDKLRSDPGPLKSRKR
jgi:hypothetical protein